MCVCVVAETKKTITQKLSIILFYDFQETQPSKSKIFQIKMYLQETPRIKICFSNLKQMVELYVYLNQDLRQTLKICFLVILFVICLYIKLYLIKIENNFLFF